MKKLNIFLSLESMIKKASFQLLVFFLFSFLLFSQTSFGQIGIPSTTAVRENFDGMAATTSLPTNWRMAASTSSPVFRTASTSVTEQASSGSPTTGGTYSWGSSSSERAVGAMTSGGFASPNSLMALYKNTNCSALTSLTVSYDAERYRINSAAASIQFFYSTNGSTWTAVTAGDVATSSFPTGSSAYNFTTGTRVKVTGITISSLSIAANDSIYLRWNFNTTGSSSQGIGIDSVNVVATFATPTIATTGTPKVLTTTYGTASAQDTINVSGTSICGGIFITAPTGFEVSKTSGSGFKAIDTIAGSGTIASTRIYYRLKANATPATYRDTLVVTSSGATTVKVATAFDTVRTKALTMSGLTGNNKVYNATTAATLSGTASLVGVNFSDVVTVGGSPSSSFATATVGTGKAITTTGYTLGGAQASYYTITQPTLTADITAKALTISGLSGVDRVYDATTTATLSGTPSLVGVETADVSNVTLGGSASASFATATAGSSKAITVTGYTISGAASGNYSVTQPTGLTANVTQATQIITFGALANKTEGDPDFTLTATASSGLPVSYSSSVPSVASVSGSTVTVGVAGTTVITASQAGNTNYQAATSVDRNQVVDTAVLLAQTITFGSLTTVTYGDAPFSLSATASSGLTVTYSSSNTAVATVSGSTVTIVGSGSTTITASQAGNSIYSAAANVAQTLTVNTKSLTITGASATSKIYDRTNTAAITGGSLVGIIGTDTVTFSGGGTFADANVGTGKAVTGALILAGAQASRYALTQPSLTADITAKNLTISGLTGNNKAYDATTTASISGTATLSGIIAPDVVSVSGSPSSVFATSSIGTGIAITVSGYTLSGAAAGNYSVTQPTGLSANITAITLTISGLTGNNKVYDRNTSATLSGSASLVGVLAADVSNVTLGGSASSSFATATVGTGKTITTTGYSISGSAAGNYTLTQPSATANITAKALTVSGATASSKTYDATTTATITGGSLVGIISPDAVTMGGGGTFADANVGTAKSVTAALTLGGTDAGNYSITQPTGLTANITKANQTISFSALASKTTSAAPFALTATASSGLTVTYTSSDASVATVSGSTLTINGAGTSNITASQAGDANWNAAADTTQAQVVTNGPLVAWDFNTISGGSSPFVQTEKNSNVTVVGLSRGSGLTAVGSPASNCWGATSFNTSTTTAATAITNNDFITFSIVANAGYKMSLSSIPAYNIRRSSTGPTSGQWQYKAGTGSYVDLGSTITWGSTTSASGNTQSAITLSGITALQSIDSVTFRIVPFGASATGGTWYLNDPSPSSGNDFQVNGTVTNGCTPATKVKFTTQPAVSADINQGSAFNVIVSAVCADGIVASAINSGTVTIDFSGCGLNSATYPGNTKTANIVNGVATFSNLVVSRSVQSGVYFTTTNTLGLTDTSSNRFNIIAPAGTTTHDTLKNDNFSTRPIAWSYSVGTATSVGSGGSSGTDVTGIQTVSGNSFLRKSYSANNGSGEKGTTNIVTFANVTGLSGYTSTDFTFKVASSVGLSGTGTGNDVGEDLTIDISTDGGTTWTKILTHEGGANKIFSLSATPQYTLSPTANTTFSSSSSQSSFKVTLPSGTSQARFRMTATNNRNEESWLIDDLLLIGHAPSGGASAPLPTVSIVGGDIICGPPYNATLTSSVMDGAGSISYRWSPGSSLADSTIASPVASPSSPTSYSLVATDSVGCVATSAMPATVSFPTPEIILVNTTTTSSGYCDAADGFRYYQAAGSSPAQYFFAIDWDADNDGIIDAAAKAASSVTVTVLSAPFASTAISNENGSVLMKRYWDVDIASSSMSEPVDVKFYYDGFEKNESKMKRDSNEAAAALLSHYTLYDVPFSWFKTVGIPMNSTVLSMINGNDFSAFPSITLTDANTGSSTDGGVLYARFNSVMSFSGGTGGHGFSPYSGIALPIELLSFTATPFNNQVNLNWSTATEINNDFFTIERSQDGIRFEPILTKKGAGNSTTTLNYRAEDKSPLEGLSYYRLKQTDFDGQFTYSMIRSVDFNGSTPILITHYPNPIAETVRFEFTSNRATPSNYVIYDAMGNMVYRGNTSTQPGINNLELDLSKLSSGIYIIKMEVDGTQLTDKFLKQ